MAKKTNRTNRPGRRGLSVSMHPLTADEALRAVLSIKPEHAKRVIVKTRVKKR